MIFTLGHSNLTEQEFVSAARGMRVIVDTRAHPSSRSVSHFNKDAMSRWLPKRGLDYEWWPSLGGWTAADLERYGEPMAEVGVDVAAYSHSYFPKQRIAAERENADEVSWWNQGLYDYSWYMTTEAFLSSIDLLLRIYDRDNLCAALVCAEAQWWRCHRSMIADYLTFLGVPCFHLPVKPPKRLMVPRYQAHADLVGNRLDRYDQRIKDRWHQWASQAKVSASA